MESIVKTKDIFNLTLLSYDRSPRRGCARRARLTPAQHPAMHCGAHLLVARVLGEHGLEPPAAHLCTNVAPFLS